MWNDILENRINMVVVKDLSRFGREHIETDAYIQKIFPSLSVRFVAVLDSYDSLLAKEEERSLLIPIKNFINDHYARDISIKIRSSQEVMRKEGICVAAYVPYGYQKRQGKLYPDLESAIVVRLIFLLKLEGKNSDEIAKWLNLWGISSPAEFRREKGNFYYTGFQQQEIAKWTKETVYRILHNRVYIGILEQGKRMRISYKVQKVISVPKENWSVIKGTHLPIISEKEYQLAEQISFLDMRRSPKEESIYLLSGFVFCGNCKKIMVRRTGRSKNKKKNYYLCSSYNKGKGCTRHTISEILLLQIIWEIIQFNKDWNEVAQKNNMWKNRRKGNCIWNIFIQKNIEKIEKYRKRIKQIKVDWEKGILTQEEYKQYQMVYQKEQERLEQAILFCEQEKEKREEERKCSKITLERLLIVWLLKRIEIYEEKKIKIWFSFQIDR